jgi:pimeloyl-ACP methyl ester carboxylesterase
MTTAIKNIVLVHGAFADGSGWRPVYDRLTARGYNVSIVQNPLTSWADDVAATRRVLARQDGPTILVGHSYGGPIITEVGTDAKVAGLVYVASFAPDVGEALSDLYGDHPPSEDWKVDQLDDGFLFVTPEHFKAGFAADLSDADAAFLRDSQVPIALDAFAVKATGAAWRTKPSWMVIATRDRSIVPELQRIHAKKIGAKATEVEGSHAVFLSKPDEVAAVIEAAAKGSAQA